MAFILTKKDIIALNQECENGNIHNEASLDYALSYAKQTDYWIKILALLVRAINIDHVFEDGNKRTAALLIMAYAKYEGYDTYDDRVIRLIANMAANKIIGLKNIEEKIKDVIKKI
ncbi:MAG: Fic family protein [Nanoarchaeota archaeon]|nr:Fic family protein [Nanoarchaeota archaeon]